MQAEKYIHSEQFPPVDEAKTGARSSAIEQHAKHLELGCEALQSALETLRERLKRVMLPDVPKPVDDHVKATSPTTSPFAETLATQAAFVEKLERIVDDILYRLDI